MSYKVTTRYWNYTQTSNHSCILLLPGHFWQHSPSSRMGSAHSTRGQALKSHSTCPCLHLHTVQSSCAHCWPLEYFKPFISQERPTSPEIITKKLYKNRYWCTIFLHTAILIHQWVWIVCYVKFALNLFKVWIRLKRKTF